MQNDVMQNDVNAVQWHGNQDRCICLNICQVALSGEKLRAHQTKVMGWIMLSLISTIHFGGLWFTPYQHPSFIDIKDT
jgi:hypothetical protein